MLITDFVCFGVLPWVQTRPPRALEAGDPWPSSFRAFNLRLLGATSIQVNTFPSGHAAEALAAALLVLGAPPGVVVMMFAAALAVSAGAVLGRYHYLADALAGWAVAVAVFWACLSPLRPALSALLNARGAPPPRASRGDFAPRSGRRRCRLHAGANPRVSARQHVREHLQRPALLPPAPISLS